MCGIVGYIGHRPCVDIIFSGLQRLEYRGYDSAGIAVATGGELGYVKTEGKLTQLKPRLSQLPPAATVGIGHTRWATHGPATTANAHPHVAAQVALVHNGIIDNYIELKEELIAKGVTFESDTDSEVVLKTLIQQLHQEKDPLAAMHRLVGQLEGAFALGVMFANEPNALFLVKQGSPLVLGVGQGEMHFASDAFAMLPYTNRAVFLDDGEIARVTPDSFDVWTFDKQKKNSRVVTLDISQSAAEKQGYRHFMLKEIYDQSSSIGTMIQAFVGSDGRNIDLTALGLGDIDAAKIDKVSIVACGTAFYSADLSKYLIEPLLGVPVAVELASEFRYRNPHIDERTLVISVSQSGETLDTLESVKFASNSGCQTLSICNVEMSSIPRASTATLYMKIGPEIGVASTKAYTGMLLSHYLIALALGKARGVLNASQVSDVVSKMRRLPALIDRALATAPQIERVARKYYEASDFLFFGRGTSFAVAMEGALKLKEISYIHAEGYAGGELKHGPIALVDRHMPIVALAPKDFYYDKMLANIEEVKAREGLVIAVGAEDDTKLKHLSDDYLVCPQVDDTGLQPILSVIPLQLLAYYIAVLRGTDVDQPRNLAKSVTVE